MIVIALAISFMPRPVMVDLVDVQPGPLVVTLDEEGETRVHDVYTLSAPVAGRVQRIDRHVGDPVAANETVLAQIEPGDPSLLDPRSEAQARAAIQAAEAARDLAAAAVKDAEAGADRRRQYLEARPGQCGPRPQGTTGRARHGSRSTAGSQLRT
jgi:HlyD family secretion protein